MDLDIVSDSQQEEVVERRRIDIDNPCVRGTYSVEKIERRYETVLIATAVGFERPGYVWTVNGEAVRPSAGASWDAVAFTTEVTIPDPEPAARGRAHPARHGAAQLSPRRQPPGVAERCPAGELRGRCAGWRCPEPIGGW